MRIHTTILLTFFLTTPIWADVVNENGDDIRDTYSIAMPNEANVRNYLNKLEQPEATWVKLLKQTMSQLNFVQTNDRCYDREVQADNEISSFYHERDKIIVYCQKSLELDVAGQVAETLQGLSWFALQAVKDSNIEDISSLVGELGYSYRAGYLAGSNEEFASAVYQLRDVLDRHFPRLLLLANPDEVLGRYELIEVFKPADQWDRPYYYPYPAFLDQNEYVIPHFLEWAMAKLGTLGRFIGYEVYPNGEPIFSESYLFRTKECRIFSCNEDVIWANPYHEHVVVNSGSYDTGFFAFKVAPSALEDRFSTMVQKLSLNRFRFIRADEKDPDYDKVETSIVFGIEN